MAYQASKLTKVPLTPSALKIPAAVLRPCSASAKLLGRAAEVLVELLDTDPAEPLAALDDEFEALEELDVLEALVVGLIGSKVLLPTPKPMAAASVPLPTIAIVSDLFLLVDNELAAAVERGGHLRVGRKIHVDGVD